MNGTKTIVVLGEMVGKSCLIYRFINNESPKEHDPTIIETYSVLIKISTGEQIPFNILDTHYGDNSYYIDEWINQADGFLLVFAINEHDSFEEIKKKYFERITKHNKDKFPIILVGNKIDLENWRYVLKSEVSEFAESNGMKYFETSDKLR